MRTLIIVGSKFSGKTSSYWKKNREQLTSAFSDADLFFPDPGELNCPKELESAMAILFVGEDPFISRAVNACFRFLANHPEKAIAFLPVNKDSALASHFNLPSNLSDYIDLIRRKQFVYQDVVKCHYIDVKGFPASYLILNDAIVGLSQASSPLIVRTVMQWIKFKSAGVPQRVSLVDNGDTLYEGNYLFSLILLGNKITSGPKIRSNVKLCQAYFDYFQLNLLPLKDYASPLFSLLTGKTGDNPDHIFRHRSKGLELRGFGTEQEIIADGNYLGKLPATFIYLTKALRVVSPVIMKPVGTSWRKKLGVITPASPISSRDVIQNNSNFYDES